MFFLKRLFTIDKSKSSHDVVAQSSDATAKDYYDYDESDRIAKDKKAKKIKVKGHHRIFEVKKSADGHFVFNVLIDKSRIIGTSKIFLSEEDTIRGINTFISHASNANTEDHTLKAFDPKPLPKWEIYINRSEKFAVRLICEDDDCICHSIPFTQKSEYKKIIETMTEIAKNAKPINI